MTHMAELTDKQEKALAALLNQPTISAAADVLGIGLRTLHTWLTEPAFSEAYRVARREATSQAIARLQQASSEAVTVLTGIMLDQAAPKTVRVTAASKVIDTAIKSVEIDDLAARIAVLEAAQEAKR